MTTAPAAFAAAAPEVAPVPVQPPIYVPQQYFIQFAVGAVVSGLILCLGHVAWIYSPSTCFEITPRYWSWVWFFVVFGFVIAVDLKALREAKSKAEEAANVAEADWYQRVEGRSEFSAQLNPTFASVLA